MHVTVSLVHTHDTVSQVYTNDTVSQSHMTQIHQSTQSLIIAYISPATKLGSTNRKTQLNIIDHQTIQVASC